MKLEPRDLGDLTDLAIMAAVEAGQMIAASIPQDIEYKPGATSLASQVVTEIDRLSEDLILEVLQPSIDRYELGLLTEERADDGGRLTADNFWCIDPLDGTLAFIESQRGYAVSIALVSRFGTPLIGVVYDPVEATLWHAAICGGSFRNQQPWSLDQESTEDSSTEPQSTEEFEASEVLSVFADRSFLDLEDHDAIIEGLGGIAEDMGLAGVRVDATSGAVMNACGVLTHAPSCYFKFPSNDGGGHLWDFAATACLFNGAGAVATDMGGEDLDLNRPDSTHMNHRGVLFASDEQLASRLRVLRTSQ